MGWLCLFFKVLPTDPRVRDLTPEQFDQLWRQFEHYHPELVKKSESYVDPEYEQFERETLEAAEGVLFDDVEIVPFEECGVLLPEGVELNNASDRPPDEWEDV